MDKGHTPEELYEAFGIYPSRITDWRKLQRETGSLKPQYWDTRKRKIDLKELEQAIERKPDATLLELAKFLIAQNKPFFWRLVWMAVVGGSAGGAVIIMDNAYFHRKNQLYKIAERYRVHIVFLSPYSPVFNKIECSFSAAKKWLKYNLHRFHNVEMALEYYFCY